MVLTLDSLDPQANMASFKGDTMKKYIQYIDPSKLPHRLEAVENESMEDYGRQFLVFYDRKIQMYCIYMRGSQESAKALRKFYKTCDTLENLYVCMLVIPDLPESIYFKCKQMHGNSFGIKSTDKILEEWDKQCDPSDQIKEMEKMAYEIQNHVEAEFEKYFLKGRTSLAFNGVKNKKKMPRKVKFVGTRTGRLLGELDTKTGKVTRYDKS